METFLNTFKFLKIMVQSSGFGENNHSYTISNGLTDGGEFKPFSITADMSRAQSGKMGLTLVVDVPSAFGLGEAMAYLRGIKWPDHSPVASLYVDGQKIKPLSEWFEENASKKTKDRVKVAGVSKEDGNVPDNFYQLYNDISLGKVKPTVDCQVTLVGPQNTNFQGDAVIYTDADETVFGKEPRRVKEMVYQVSEYNPTRSNIRDVLRVSPLSISPDEIEGLELFVKRAFEIGNKIPH